VELNKDELDSVAFYLLMYTSEKEHPQILKDEALAIYEKIRGI